MAFPKEIIIEKLNNQNNLLFTEREEVLYWEALAQGQAVNAKTFDGQYFTIRLEQDGSESSLLNGTR